MDSSSSDSSLEDIIDAIDRLERPRIFRHRTNAFEKYGENEFRQRYRLSKQTVLSIIQMLQGDLLRMTDRNCCLSPAEQVLIALRFYATGSFQVVIGDDFGVHKNTVSRVVAAVTNLLARLRLQYINFPNVIGCIDGTHVKILSPGGDNAELFRNRKGYFSINVQAVCDSNLMIRDIDARWYGSTHDSTIFNASLLRARCEAAECRGSYLMGDSAYPCKEYLMTPLLNPTTQAERRYNEAHIHTRNCIERTFGVWKRRFACLSLGLRTQIDKTLHIIIATAVLHNIAILEKDPDIYDDVELNEEVEQNGHLAENDIGGNAVRRALIDNTFM